MPRGVFWLMWETMKAGKPVGAYVKNLARDGLHYWVFATVSPVADGYLSVRLKPTCGILKMVETEYAALRQRELDEKLEPADSAALFLARLRELGYPDYETFMATALLSEMSAKEIDKGSRNRPIALKPLLGALSAILALKQEASALHKMFSDMTCTLVNMRLIASRIEGANGPISLMAQNYATVLSEARDWLHRFAFEQKGDIARISGAIREGAFDYGAATLQRQMIGQFLHEGLPPESGDKATETAHLEGEVARMMSVAADSLAMIVSSGRSLERAIQEVRRSCAGLNSTRMMCRAEAARLGNTGTFATIIDTLDESQNRIEDRADKVLDHCHDLRGLIAKVAETMG
jgi:aerotaxis receptor